MKTKPKGIHANTRGGLRPLKKGEEVVYGGAGFHIVKKKEAKTAKSKPRILQNRTPPRPKRRKK